MDENDSFDRWRVRAYWFLYKISMWFPFGRRFRPFTKGVWILEEGSLAELGDPSEPATQMEGGVYGNMNQEFISKICI